MHGSDLLKVENVDIVFNVGLYRSASWRDLFTGFCRNPVQMFHATQERLQVARDISFELRRGERVGLLGVNGAGKTSLCRAIAGMYTPTRGRIRLDGDVRAIFNTHVGVLPELTGRENAELLVRLIFAGENAPVDYHSIAEEAIEFAELGRFADVPFKHYSNGMQARLCLSLISAKASDLLILDEVFEGADAYFREKAARRVLNMIEKSGGVIFVSHSAEQIQRACNRVLVLDHGRIVYDGAVEQGIQEYKAICSNQPVMELRPVSD